MIDMIYLLPTILGSLGLGSVLTWWLTHRFGLEIAHKHRVIEEHTKKVHEYSEKYYVKLSMTIEFLERHLRQIFQELSAGMQPSGEAIELSLFTLARLGKLEENWIVEASGTLMFTDRTGERLVACLRRQADELLFARLCCIDRAVEGILRQHIDLHENLAQFRVKMCDPQLKAIANKYQTQVQSDVESLGLLAGTLRCLNGLLYFEMNTCFDCWYGKKTPKPCLDDSDRAILTAACEELEKEGRITTKEKRRYYRRIGLKTRRTRGNLSAT